MCWLQFLAVWCNQMYAFRVNLSTCPIFNIIVYHKLGLLTVPSQASHVQTIKGQIFLYYLSSIKPLLNGRCLKKGIQCLSEMSNPGSSVLSLIPESL